MNTITAKKVGMTQLFDQHQRLIPVTVVKLLSLESKSPFQANQILNVQGISKGKGFQGVVKRFGAKGAPSSHGRKHDLRRVGSIGSSFPERVVKGKRMPGRMGSKRLTIKNLQVVRVDSVNNLIAIKGALPGARGALIKIQNLKQKT